MIELHKWFLYVSIILLLSFVLMVAEGLWPKCWFWVASGFFRKLGWSKLRWWLFYDNLIRQMLAYWFFHWLDQRLLLFFLFIQLIFAFAWLPYLIVPAMLFPIKIRYRVLLVLAVFSMFSALLLLKTILWFVVRGPIFFP